jgi:hypothetical protein
MSWLMPFLGFLHEISMHFIGALMGGLKTRIVLLEAVTRRRPRPGISAERRKALTDRAVLHGDLEALQELSLYRPDKINASKERRAAALAGGMRADLI